MSTHNLCFEQKYEKYQNFYLKIFFFLALKFSVYLNRHVLVMFQCLSKAVLHVCGISWASAKHCGIISLF